MFLKRLLKKIRHGVSRSQGKSISVLYLPIKKNYSYSKKSKNSRMGKGKGALTRYLIRVQKFKPFLYFGGCYPESINKLSNTFSSKTRVLLKSHILMNDRSFVGLGPNNHPYTPLSFTRLK